MKRALFVSLLLLPLLAAASPDEGPPPVRRFALLVGVNDGGPSRVRLRYAVSDAKAVSQVLGELGGVLPGDRILVLDADRAALEDGMNRLRRMIDAAKSSGGRTEALLYYSGHSDEEGLMLKQDRLSYRELRQALNALTSDVRIAILDSCASGAMARQKGGVRRPAFLVDASSSVRGHAILTSSSEDEVSQESDRIGGSYFTHNLVSGLRGAADLSGDGRVTLNEAYQFAFNETLARTEKTRAGAQHPAYDIDLAGSGDLVMTELRTNTAGLVLAGPLDGRLYVRDAPGNLVMELEKRAGRPTELALPPGQYTVTRERQGGGSRASFALAEGRRTSLGESDFSPMAGELTVSRGGGAMAMGAPAREHSSRFFNVGLVPLLQTNSVLEGPVDNNLSLSLLVGSSARLRGVALALLGHWATDEVAGAQLSVLANVSGADVRGLQSSVGANWASGSIAGGQASVAFNHARGDVTGVQASAGVNLVQGRMRGIQGSVAVNWAAMAEGAQLSLVNVGGDVSGAQVGLLNIARRMRGLQLGLVNVSGDMEGVPFGLISVAGNGQFHVEVTGSDLHPLDLAIKLGSKSFYTVFTGGYGTLVGGEARWSMGLGLGGHVSFDRWFIDLDAVGRSVFVGRTANSNLLLAQLRLLGGFQIAPRFAVIAGPSFNTAISLDGAPMQKVSFMSGEARGELEMWPGFQVGLRF
ncbi:caspase family protein [Archangium violaceum]|uniref:caspase family protein n=1 Tax=Archangium violaceum TaxID=83451 RepID=UPI00194DCC11|nr:caspase family protein [Archangium violaceum]QRN93634.1 caspase family protein [Archangium violaceum]